jgi:uroporphyrin-III C-methyltransferase
VNRIFDRQNAPAPAQGAAAAGGAGGPGVSPPGAAGHVWLVGTGPGDPDLLTVRAARLIAQADVVLYDNLVSPAILGQLPASAERHYVGKRRAQHSLPQEELNQRMVELARAGRQVLRLKGGDPFIFGRGGEELEALTRAGIACTVVPGITAANGVAAAAGIALTHRKLAQSCVLVTGHRQDAGAEPDWAALARPGQTVVVYMGLLGLATVCERLQAHGMPPATPAALVEHGTLPDQRVIEGTVADLAARVAAAGVRAPTLLIVGQVVGRRVLPLSTFPFPPGPAGSAVLPGK